jgi:phospholipid-binding lipoprotein MlaA
MMLLVLRKIKMAILLGLIATMVGCASIPAGVERSPQDPGSPSIVQSLNLMKA